MRAGTQLLDDVTRHSRALDVELIADPDERASREVRNGLRQYDAVVEMVEHHLNPDRPFKLRVSTILHLQRFALEGISTYAGVFRPAGIEIGGSKHQPIGAHQVPESVEELCDYVNIKWNEKSPIHLSAYVLWRLNWIHPFVDGNGRTSRATSYLVLILNWAISYPDQKYDSPANSEDKNPYYKALETADEAYRNGRIDLDGMEELLSEMLARQLYSVHKQATNPTRAGD